MNARHARYPFTAEAREAVQSAGVTLESVVQREAPAVERGRERVERALLEGTIESETPGRWDTADELLSYPIARVLVSLLGVPAAVEKYAAAEAATAHERFAEDLTGDATLRSVSRSQLSLSDLLEEFDLADDVRPERNDGGSASGTGAGAGTGTGAAHESDRFRVAVGAYLRLADPDWGGDWRLAVRELADGEVRITRAELHRMLEAAVRERVAEGLPFDVRASTEGEAIADALADEEEALRTLLSDRDPVPDVGVVRPDRFPPCIAGLLERAREAGIDEAAGRDGGSADRDGRGPTDDEPRPLSPTSAFTLQAFLTDLGMDAEAVATLQGAGEADTEAVATRAEYIADGSRSQYPPPSCETVQAYGDCPGPDERCETIASPLAYYVDAVADDEGAGTSDEGAGASDDEGETNENADADGDRDADPITSVGGESRGDDGSAVDEDGADVDSVADGDDVSDAGNDP